MPSLLDRWRSWRDDNRRTNEAIALSKRGDELHAAGQAREAIDVLQRAITLAGASDAPHPSLYGVKGTVLLTANMTLSYAAAKVGDRTLALDSIRNARSCLALARRAESFRPDEAIVKWEGWANEYAGAAS
jgi:hypothetical protein